MPHTVTHRELTPEEFAANRRLGRRLNESLGNLLLPILPVGMSVLGWFILCVVFIQVAEWLGKDLREEAKLFMLIGALVIGLAGWVYFFRVFRRNTLRKRKDVKDRRAEVVRVEDVRVLQVEEHNDEGPIYLFDIGDAKVLALMGQWLMDDEVFGLPPRPFDKNDELIGEIPFPASSFTVHRLPKSGDVLRIELHGAPIRPLGIVPRKSLPAWFLRPVQRLEFLDSMLLDADFRELESHLPK